MGFTSVFPPLGRMLQSEWTFLGAYCPGKALPGGSGPVTRCHQLRGALGSRGTLGPSQLPVAHSRGLSLAWFSSR